MELFLKVCLEGLIYAFVFSLSIKLMSKVVRFLNLNLRQWILTLSTILMILYIISILVGPNDILILIFVLLLICLIIIFGVILLKKVDYVDNDKPLIDTQKITSDSDDFPGLEEIVRNEIDKEAKNKLER